MGLNETTSPKNGDKDRSMLDTSDGPRQDLHVEPATKGYGLPEKACSMTGFRTAANTIPKAEASLPRGAADATRPRRCQLIAIASLTQRALAGTAATELLGEAISAAAKGLGAEFAEVLEVRNHDELAVVASVGPEVHRSIPDCGHGRFAQARYTLEVGGPVVVQDRRCETRFPTSHLRSLDCSAGLTVLITVDGTPYGVMGSYSKWTLPLTDEDVYFFQAIANVVGMAIERDRHREVANRQLRCTQLAELGQMAADVAHELSNVVASVGLYAELLDRRQGLDQTGRVQVAAIRDQVHRGTALLWQVLESASRIRMQPESIDIAASVEPNPPAKDPHQRNTLGLSQIGAVIEQHGGRIELIDPVDGGSAVRVRLPAPARSGPADPAATAEVIRGLGERVLVVDDDSAMRAALTNLLKRLGYTATEASSGEEALSWLEDHAPSIAVVVCDVIMPGMGGENLATSINARWPAVPVILVSGYPPPPLAADALEDSSPALPILRLQKPFSSRQMAQALDTALHAR